MMMIKRRRDVVMTTGGKFRFFFKENQFFNERGDVNDRRGDVAKSINDSNWFIQQATRMYLHFFHPLYQIIF